MWKMTEKRRARRRGAALCAGVLAVAVLAAGCGNAAVQSGGGSASGSAPGVDTHTKTITVGASTQMTGPVSFYDAINQGAKAYFAMVNAEGGVDGWKINYKLLDDGYQPVRNLQNVKTLVQNDHVFALVANEGTSTNTAAANYLGGTSTPVVAPTEGNPALSRYGNYFVLMPNYVETGATTAAYLVHHAGAKRIGMLYENDDLGQPALSGAQQALKRMGKQLVAAVPFNVTDTNFVPYVSQLKQANVDTVMIWGSNANVASAMKAADQLGVNVQWYAPFFIADPSTVHLASQQDLARLRTVSWYKPYSSTDPQVQQFRHALKKYSPAASLGALAENGWNSGAMFVAGLKTLVASGKAITQPNLIAVLNSLNGIKFGTLTGDVAYSSGDHRVGYTAAQSTSFAAYKDGRFDVTTPPTQFPSGLKFGS